jgi:hypothetical protein
MYKAFRWSLLLATAGLCSFSPSQAGAQSKTFTTNADFDGGTITNTCHGPGGSLNCWDQTPDQLVLGRTQVSKVNRVWADNYKMGWVVGIDAATGRQFARFDSAVVSINGQATGGQPSAKVSGAYFCDFSTKGNCPGRVTTDTNGDVWIINRAFGQQGTLSKFSGSLGHCIDRNNNGVIDTSNDANGDGIVDPDNPNEYFAQKDECILATIPLGAPGALPRGVAVDKKGKIWASTFNGQQVFRFNPNEPVKLEAVINLKDGQYPPQVNTNTPYSMATGKDHVFLSGAGGYVVRIHIDTLEVDYANCTGTYGVVADPGGDVAYFGGYFSGGNLYRANFADKSCLAVNKGTAITAVTLDLDGNVWASGYGNGTLHKSDPNNLGDIITFGNVGANPHGLSVDFSGRIWSIMHSAPFIKVFDTNGTPVGLPVTPSLMAPTGYNYDPYLYSDFTGAQIDRQAPYIRLGSWEGSFDGGANGIPWNTVRWNQEPQGVIPDETTVVFSARSADTPDLLGQAAYEPVQNGVPFNDLKGRYIQVKADFTGPGYATPILSDVSVQGPCAVTGQDCCLSDGDCTAPDLCTQAFCPGPGQVCQFKPTAGCCMTDADCNDKNSCTTDSCPTPGQACAHDAQPGCCNTNADCDDNEACTADLCTGPGGTCSHKEINGCCYKDADCNTGSQCLSGKCPGPGQLCEIDPIPGCCAADSDCNDGDACTIDKCDVAKHTCNKPQQEADCCKTDADCDDKDPCTTDQCSGPGGKCKHKEIAECCTDKSPEVGQPCDPPKSPNDKAPCAAGKLSCKGNKLVCDGAVKPSQEVCDGIDNDCDGQVDTGSSLCPTGKACSKGLCASKCKEGEFPCATGFTCDSGYCLPIGGTGGAGGNGSGGAAGGKAQGGAAGGVAAGGASAGGASAGGGKTTGGAAGAVAAGGGKTTGGAAGGVAAGGASAGGGTGDGAATDAASSDSGGCGCQVPGSSGGPAGSAGLLALVAGLALQRRAGRRTRKGA